MIQDIQRGQTRSEAIYRHEFVTSTNMSFQPFAVSKGAPTGCILIKPTHPGQTGNTKQPLKMIKQVQQTTHSEKT